MWNAIFITSYQGYKQSERFITVHGDLVYQLEFTRGTDLRYI